MLSYFQKKVLDVVLQIPTGKVSTYKLVAKSIGDVSAFRAVGNALHKNPHPVHVPCHRVIKSNGAVGGYIFGQKRKIDLLKQEGVRFNENGTVLSGYIMNT